MIEHKYPTAFPLKHQQKDMRLALELAQQHGQELPTAAAANHLYEKVSVQTSSCECLYVLQCPVSVFHGLSLLTLQAKDLEKGDEDFSSVLEAVLQHSK